MKRVVFSLFVSLAIVCSGQVSNDSRGIVFYNSTDACSLLDGNLNLDTSGTNAWSAGRMSWDATSGTALIDTAYTNVRVNVGQETHVRFFNNTGTTITNGTVVNANGATNGVPTVILADASSPAFSSAVLGLATADVLDGEIGVATRLGDVRGLDTSGQTLGGVSYLSEDAGQITSTRPQYPANIVILGTVVETNATDGVVFADITRFKRNALNESYGFTSQGIGAGAYWKAGFYDWAAADANLDQASPSVTHGTAGRVYAAHVGVVANGAGTVDTGQVGLRVIGVEDLETGAQIALSTNVITTDITTLTANTMVETSSKHSGQVTIEFYTVSGSPTAYSLDFNYGYSKYSDFENRDFTITGFEIEWQGAANDSAFDVELLKHTTSNWTYAATGFVPGDGAICQKSVDQSEAGNVVTGEDGAYKRVDLNEYIAGGTDEGYIIRVTTGQNNTIQNSDIHVRGESEELTR